MPRRSSNMAAHCGTLLLLLLMSIGFVGGENLWCYQCNTDLRDGHKGECNDPYSPRHTMDLIRCPQNEQYQCLKSVVLYRNVLVTVRGCVPSRSVDDYCWHEASFPDSAIECLFCKDYACNRATSTDLPSMSNILSSALILLILTTIT